MSASIEQDICFDVDGTATHGTLRVPAHREGRRLAAALLLPGSGPVDRNGDVPGLNLTPRTLALIAEVLAELGIMSLRFDKYFAGRTGAGAYAKDPGLIDLDAFIRQENARYVRQGDAVHPVAAAAKVAPGTRVLVTAGTRDASIPVSAIKLLAVVLAGVGTTGPGLRVLAGVDHFLHHSGTSRNEPVLRGRRSTRRATAST